MHIIDILWLPDIIEKLDAKHNVQPYEVEEIFMGQPNFRRIERGKIHGENLYTALGQTEAGRYLIVYFIRKPGGVALVISARDMDPRERRQYGHK
ncbi:MAG TPA: BrnT family toxin [Anaerolineae bacterium]|nr:BrnT family toxin [Anaerolineae bacterium]